MRVIAIVAGDDPQQALQRVELLIHDPAQGDLLKFLPGAEVEDLSSEAPRAFRAQIEAAAKALASLPPTPDPFL